MTLKKSVFQATQSNNSMNARRDRRVGWFQSCAGRARVISNVMPLLFEMEVRLLAKKIRLFYSTCNIRRSNGVKQNAKEINHYC